VLASRGWRAAAVAVDAPVADAWDLLGQRRPRVVRAGGAPVAAARGETGSSGGSWSASGRGRA